MASLHIRAGRGLNNMRTPLSPIFETENDIAVPAKWEEFTQEVWSPIRPHRLQRRPLKFGPSNLLSRFPATIDERAEHEFMPIPFPRIESDLIDLTEEDPTPQPEPRMGLRKRTRTPTLAVVEFDGEEEEEADEEEVIAIDEEVTAGAAEEDLPSNEHATNLPATDLDADLPEIPTNYQNNLLDEDLPGEAPELDILDDAEWESDADNVASRTWEFMMPPSPQHEEPLTPPVLSRPSGLSSPIGRSFIRSPSPLSLPPSSASSSSSPSSISRSLSPSTPPPSSPTPGTSRLPRLSHARTKEHYSNQSSDVRLSWTGMPANLFDSFLGAEKEYRRLRSIVEAPSLFEEEMYDSDATVRPSRSRSRVSRWERENYSL